MIDMTTRLLASFILILVGTAALSQCCSGGVPVSSNLGFAAQLKGTLQINVSTDFNILKALYAGSDRLEDAGRKRSTQSYILRTAYSPFQRFTVEAMMPYVRQTRSIYGPGGTKDFESTGGIGDATVLLTYDLVHGSYIVRAGGGVQIPLGSFDERNDQGLFLVEDLQPGGGAWNPLFYASIETTLNNRPSASIYLNSIYRTPGTNTGSRGGNQDYQFGNDLQLIGGYNDQLLFLGQIWTMGAGLRYRSAQRDAIDGFDNDGTGGRFLFFRLNQGIAFGQHQITANIELPLYKFVNETQLVPNVAFGIGWYTRLSLIKSHNSNILK